MATQTPERPKSEKAELNEGKQIADIPRFWLEKGIVFELNRRFFHPCGYSLTVDYIDRNNKELGMKFIFSDFTHKPTHTFRPDIFKQGRAKWNQFWKTTAIVANNLRQQTLGFTVQSHPDYREDQKKVG